MEAKGPGSRERVDQKTRTRQALMDAARTLVREGGSPSVADVADAAGISRATAYRYFPSQHALLSESTLYPFLGDETHLDPARLFDVPKAPTDVEDRITLVSDTMWDFVCEREVQFRRFLPTQIVRGLESAPDRGPVRPSYRVAMIEAALEPISDELSRRQWTMLVHGLSALVGPEALIAMRDVLHVDHDVARKEIAWSCRAMVRGARAEAATAREVKGRPRKIMRSPAGTKATAGSAPRSAARRPR